MGIDLHALDILVSLQLIDIADIGTVIEHVGCAGMPHGMTGSLLADKRRALTTGTFLD